jgi:fatty-acyl-CoA synthase
VRFTVAQVHEAIAATRPEAPALVVRDEVLSWRLLTERSRRFANALLAHGLGAHTERPMLEAWASGQDHVALYLHNGSEYLEAMLGAFKARAVPCNVNFRYVAEELAQLLGDADVRAIVFHSAFAPVLRQVLSDLPGLELLIQVADDSEEPLLAGAQWYADLLEAASPELPDVEPDPDDLYVLYTGGTTNTPKGVMWHQAEALTECFGLPRTCRSLDEVVALASSGRRAMVTAPLMHGAGQWVAFSTWNAGGTVYLQSSPDRFDAADVWDIVERRGIDFLLIVGDAVARPLLDELMTGQHDPSSLSVVLSGGAPLSSSIKDELLRHLPGVIVIDGLGASESGGLGSSISGGPGSPAGRFPTVPGACVLAADLTRVLPPGDPELGWLAKSGGLALGYLGDESRSRRTFPTIDGVRYVVPGDRARLLADGAIELHGRDSVTINSGGEKIFVEEVEMALRTHPQVYDCVVAGRPSERWGQEVVAVVQLRPGASSVASDLRDAASRHIARYKLPKAFVFVDRIERSPSGKADYRWARTVAEAGTDQ